MKTGCCGVRGTDLSPRTERALPLTPREHDVLERLATGARTREIAHQLEISEPTVKRHLTNMYRKLGVTNRVEAVAWHFGRGR